MVGARFRRKLPGILATGLVTLTTTLWTFWGVGEMYYEGWWGAWYNRLPYLGPPAICLAFTLVAVTWPRVGGGILIVAGGAFTACRWGRQAQLGALTVEWMLGWFPISGLLVITDLCRYLSGDGAALMPEPQDVWRTPTADEVVRSLVQGGESAGCTWGGVCGC